ncbi:Brix domain protein [Ceratobasidium sp. AG-Ba]|nr:Brix domain protein [Ceratobasidium sp. AG-Ba]
MPPTRFAPSLIKNKEKREEIHQSRKKSKGQEKLRRRLALAEAERKNPSLKQKRISENVPRTLDNTREFNASIIPVVAPLHKTGDESTDLIVDQEDLETTLDIANDTFTKHFDKPNNVESDQTDVPKI